MADNKQVKSKQRVADHGEVFTAEREVKAMVDLVDDEANRIDSRFLEPACGDGNFLAEILTRKLEVVKKQYSRYKSDFEKYSVVAVASLYGVDIMPDNVADCRKRLYDLWNKYYKVVCKKDTNEDCQEAVRFIIERNILCGDALTMLQNNGEPIVFSQWSLIGIKLKRTDFTMAHLLEKQEEKELPIYENKVEGNAELLPKPVADFPSVYYRSVHKNG